MQSSGDHYTNPRITFSNYLTHISREKTISSIIDGLTSIPKQISSIYFYDAKGSELFEKITACPEYYLTKIEKQLISVYSKEMCQGLCDIDIVELGSGDCSKISIMLNAISDTNLPSVCYRPLDISIDALKKSSEILTSKFPDLTVHCMAADFTTQFHLIPRNRKRLFCFFGSTIGNLSYYQRADLLVMIAKQMRSDDRLLLGVDMVKPRVILERAYNDYAKITAQFNLNILNVVNYIANTNFDPDSFKHIAFFNEELSRMEMHLRATKKMSVSSPTFPVKININNGEMIHTESSHKFTIQGITDQVESAGLNVEQIITDPKKWFSLVLISR